MATVIADMWIEAHYQEARRKLGLSSEAMSADMRKQLLHASMLVDLGYHGLIRVAHRRWII